MNAIQNSFISNLYTDNSYCPALREVVTTPPEYLGKAFAVVENTAVYFWNNPTVQIVADYIIDNPVTRVIGSGLVKANDAVLSATGGLVTLPTAGALTAQHRTPIILGALATVAAGQVLFAALRDEGLGAAASLVGQGTLLALRTIVHLPVDILKFTFKTLPIAAIRFLINIPGTILNTGIYLAKSKLLWAASPYIATKISYNILCDEYEAEVSKTKRSADLIDRIRQGYESQSNRHEKWLNSASATELASHFYMTSGSRDDLLKLLEKRGFDQSERDETLKLYDTVVNFRIINKGNI